MTLRRGWLAVCGVLCLTLGGCRAASADVPESRQNIEAAEESTVQDADTSDVVYLSMATSGKWNDILRGELFEEYSQKLLEWSDGKLVMKVYYGGELGNDLELIEGVQQGTLSIINSVPSYQISAVPEAALLDIPGMFDSTGEYNYFIDNYYLEELQEFYQKEGIRLLSSSAFSYRQLTSNRDIQSMEDLKGLKLRSMENPYQIAFWQSMGAMVTPMNFNEVRLAIQQGVLEAQENPLGYMISENMAEVQNYIILTNHVPMISNYLMNEEQYQALSQENKDLLARFMDEMSRELVEQEPEEEKEILATLKMRGIQIHEASSDIVEGIQTGREVVIQMLREDLGDEVVDDFLAKVEAAKAAYQE